MCVCARECAARVSMSLCVCVYSWTSLLSCIIFGEGHFECGHHHHQCWGHPEARSLFVALVKFELKRRATAR